ncbi:hypothetical protein N7495_004710 [Penicillium taxi]|uniref:uncharacterized protein n=1 Tax=Penicillium taxi TaxID=168475 RepID=UPI002545B204|nr:uncharacterized protein N7495_004710 [Penicillium taxi]KAJ5899966.1 hypothetical protein N7495_004710 [Penicillium taxi]
MAGDEEDAALLARIEALAGAINRHKNAQNSQSQPYVNRHEHSHPGWAPYRGRGRGGYRGGFRGYRGGYRGGFQNPHRHNTLILNHATHGSTNPTPVPVSGGEQPTPAQTSNGFVAKHGRHMQLINTSVYDKETAARTKAIEATRQLRERKRSEREESKVINYAHAGVAVSPASQQILINDVPFTVTQGGSKLLRTSSDANKTPKSVNVAGVTFVRSKKGNLHRLGAVKNKPASTKKRNELCKRFTQTGSCEKGPTCPYIHDPNKVAICKAFLQTGECKAGLSCDLSHEPSPHRSPACLHFIRGRCANPACRYSHVRVTPGSPVCRAFATIGYCDKGSECQESHVHECPDYANNGVCHKRRCKLPHVDRAGQIRKAAAAAANKALNEHNDSDPSSEEEDYDEIDSDDVESDSDDEMEEILTGVDTGEISGQQDFIRL